MPTIPIFCNIPGVRAGIAPDATLVEGRVVLPKQTHSCRVAIVPDEQCLDDTDALITRSAHLPIGVRTADCVPVLLHAPDIRAVGAVHAGWKGSLGGIVSEAVEQLKRLGADPALMLAAFGPSICGECYEVSHELADKFRSAGFSECIIGDRNLDLEAVNRARLIRAGLSKGNIQPKPCCTFQTPFLPSWRRAHTDSRLVTWIEIL